MSKIFFQILIILILILLVNCNRNATEKHQNKTKYVFDDKIKKLRNNNFNTFVLSNKANLNSKWLLVFYSRNCNYCKHIIHYINTKLVFKYKNNSNVNFGIIDLDLESNIWLGLRFNISVVPYIALIEQNLLFHYTQPFDEPNIIKFIDSEKNVEDGVEIPEEINKINRLSFAFNRLSEKVALKINNILKKLKINYEIKSSFSCLIIFGIVTLIFFLEYKFLKFSYKKTQKYEQNSFNDLSNIQNKNKDKKE